MNQISKSIADPPARVLSFLISALFFTGSAIFMPDHSRPAHAPAPLLHDRATLLTEDSHVNAQDLVQRPVNGRHVSEK
jgi:hypothetical protein